TPCKPGSTARPITAGCSSTRGQTAGTSTPRSSRTSSNGRACSLSSPRPRSDPRPIRIGGTAMSRPQPATWNADPAHFTRPTRRDFLSAGGLGGLGLTLGSFLKLEAARAADSTKRAEPKAKSVIHIYLQGGFAHMDSFDPKPDAPAEYRGILGTVATKLPGVRFSEHMVKTAALADRLTVVRSMSHTEVDHSRGEHSMFTGYRPSPALVYPSLG